MRSPNVGHSFVDFHFDELTTTPQITFSRDTRKRLPHCDCRRAQQAAGKRSGDCMVPTKSVDGFCVYCKCASFLQVPVSGPQATSEQVAQFEASLANFKRGQAVGLSLATGEVFAYPSARAAEDAGFGAVLYATKVKHAIKGIIWRKVA